MTQFLYLYYEYPQMKICTKLFFHFILNKHTILSLQKKKKPKNIFVLIKSSIIPL